MYDFKVISDDDRALICKILDRAEDLGIRINKLSLGMSIHATHDNCPLRLAELLKADDFNFSHDIYGISHNVDRNTGKLMNCFIPRFAS